MLLPDSAPGCPSSAHRRRAREQRERERERRGKEWGRRDSSLGGGGRSHAEEGGGRRREGASACLRSQPSQTTTTRNSPYQSCWPEPVVPGPAELFVLKGPEMPQRSCCKQDE
eukprot:1899768-Rhodomonas_salina.1